MIREEAESEERPRRRSRIRWRRVAVWTAVLAVLIAGALVGARAYIDRQWYVGEANGRVAIYNGIPTTVIGIDLFHVEQVTNLDARRAQQLQPWSELGDGITAPSLSDAQRIVEQIRRDLQPGGAG
jgi:protein phosphatase